MSESTDRSPVAQNSDARNQYWRSQPNDARETWVFLTIGIPEDHAGFEQPDWRLATGNASQLVEVYGRGIQQTDLEESLYGTLNSFREDEATLFTPTDTTLQYLRSYLLKTPSIEDPTLRGFTHVALVKIIEDHFADPEQLPLPIDELRGRPADQAGTDDFLESCWEVRTAIGHLLPQEAIQGAPL